jgi:hypothetical protein
MKTVHTIRYSGQGYIYRCPECDRPDRRPWSTPPRTAECRLCGEEFVPEEVHEMDDGLYGVIREINTLETGTPFGMSPEQMRKSDLAKAGRSVGIDVPAELMAGMASSGPPGDSFAPWRITPEAMRKMYETPEGREVLEAAGSIMMGQPTAHELAHGTMTVPSEVIREARMVLLMGRNPGLTREQKVAKLKEAGFEPDVDRKGRVYVFFGSTVAPECDSYCYWD